MLSRGYNSLYGGANGSSSSNSSNSSGGSSSSNSSNSSGGSSSSFGWSLTSSGFYLYSGSETVMKVTSSGLEVAGKVTASSGSIGGFDIADDKLTASWVGILNETMTTTLNPSSIKFSSKKTNGKETSVQLSSNGITLHKESLYGSVKKFLFLTMWLSSSVGIELYVDQYGNVTGAPFGGLVTI